jgi:hypothetical protein
MLLPLMSAQVVLSSESLPTESTPSSLPRTMGQEVPAHILLTRIPKFASWPRTENRLCMSSNMIVPLAVFLKKLITARPIAEEHFILLTLVISQTVRRDLFEQNLAVCLGTGIVGRLVGREWVES